MTSARLFGVDDALDSDAWYTPAWVFDGLGVRFDLDVASPAEPLPWLPADHRYTVADDGLAMPWFGLVWCNPPYSAPTAWCRKWAQHPDGFLLIRADLSTSGPVHRSVRCHVAVRPGQAHPVRQRPRRQHRRRQLFQRPTRPWRHSRHRHRTTRRNVRWFGSEARMTVSGGLVPSSALPGSRPPVVAGGGSRSAGASPKQYPGLRLDAVPRST